MLYSVRTNTSNVHYQILPFAIGLSAVKPGVVHVTHADTAGHARLLGSKVPSKLPAVPMLEKMYRK